MRKKVALVAAAFVALTGLLSGCGSAQLDVERSPVNTTENGPVTSLGVLGDSISQATNSCGEQQTCPANSWAAGTNTRVNSIAQRIDAVQDSHITRINAAVPGSKMADILKQVDTIAAEQPDAILVLAGTNDYCTQSVADMTSAAAFQTAADTLIARLHARIPAARILVASVPDPAKIFAGGAQNPEIRRAWSAGQVCPALLANAQHTDAASTAARAAVRTRALAYNRILAQTCAGVETCWYDNGALFELPFDAATFSHVDYLHPSVAGQAAIANQLWIGGASRLLTG